MADSLTSETRLQVRVRCPAEPELAQWTLQGQSLSHTMAPTMTIQVRLPSPFSFALTLVNGILPFRVCHDPTLAIGRQGLHPKRHSAPCKQTGPVLPQRLPRYPCFYITRPFRFTLPPSLFHPLCRSLPWKAKACSRTRSHWHFTT